MDGFPGGWTGLNEEATYMMMIMMMMMVMMVMMVVMMMMMMMVMMMMVVVMLVIPLDHGVVDWAAVGQEKGVAEVFHLR